MEGSLGAQHCCVIKHCKTCGLQYGIEQKKRGGYDPPRNFISKLNGYICTGSMLMGLPTSNVGAPSA